MPFDARIPKNKSVVVIRTASAHELTNYEKHKLKTIEENAQENKIESIKLNINGKELFAGIANKEAVIHIGDLALRNQISPADIDTNETFFINCALDNLEESEY
jgi:hypothetical protein